MIYHYVECDYIDYDFTGVPRFDYELHKAIPELITISKKRGKLPQLTNKDVVITSADFSLEIPENVKCIAVTHGVAKVHIDREPTWPGQLYVNNQLKLKNKDNLFFISVSDFTSYYYKKCYNIDIYKKILHSVDTKPIISTINKSNNIIGDWRNNNKGKYIIDKLKKINRFNFNTLKCGPYNKSEAYSQNSIYLSLSLSEGNSYSILDAIACGLPVLSTNVGLFYNDNMAGCGEVINYKDRNNINIVLDKLEYMYDNYDNYDTVSWLHNTIPFNVWCEEWKYLLNEIMQI